MDLDNLIQIMQLCHSYDPNQVKEAERLLKEDSLLPRHAEKLLYIAAKPEVDLAVRQIAAINLKNFVKKSWAAHVPRPDAPAEFSIPDEDKVVVRENIFDTLLRAPHVVQTQLGEIFKVIIYEDFPEKWPGLIEKILPCLSQQDPILLHGSLYALRIVCRKYEFRSEEDREPLDNLINLIFGPVLTVFKQLLAQPAETPGLAPFLKLCCKVFWSCTYLTIPSKLMEEEQFSGWMTCLHTALLAPAPQEALDSNEEARPQHPWWKFKKWVMHISYRLFSRYGMLSTRGEDADSEKAFATRYNSQCMIPFIDACLTLIEQLTKGSYLSPRVVNVLFQYLGTAVRSKQSYKRLGPHWDGLLHNVAFPLMCFNAQDEQLWNEDPHEYVRKGYDLVEDMYNPKTAAANFAHDLCEKDKKHLQAFMGMIAGLLAKASAVPVASLSKADAWRLDGALLAVGCMCGLLKSKKPYKEQLGHMLVTYVAPCFQSPHAHLRAKACWLAGVFCDVKFHDGCGSGATFFSFFEQVVRCLTDNDLPVKMDAVVALRSFMEEINDSSQVEPIVPQLLTTIFGLMDTVDNEDVVFTLEAIVEKLSDRIVPYALQMTQQLAAAFWKYISSSETEDDADDDSASVGIYSCLRAFNTLLESVSSQPELYLQLEEPLFPIMQKLISADGQDVMEEVLEMLSYFTYYTPTITDRLWTLWPQLEKGLLDFGMDFWENFLVPLDNYISRGKERFLTSTNPDYMASVFKMVQESLVGDYAESELTNAAKLLEVVLQNCRGQVDQWVGPYIQLVMTKLARSENRRLKDMLILVVANALYYNAQLTLTMLTQAPGGVGGFFQTWFQFVFESKKNGEPKHFRRQYDKKVCILGLAAVMACPDEALPPEIVGGMPQLLAGITRLLVQLKKQQEEDEEAYNEGEEEEEEEEGEEGGEGGDNEDDDDEEVAEENDADVLAELEARRSRRLKSLMDGDNEESDDECSDDEFTDDEEVMTPIDEVNPFELFAVTLMGVQQSWPARYQQMMGAADANAQQSIAGMVTYAQQLKDKAAAEAAAKQQQE
uniref:Importin N-terminal domain-containing protein n=1 Tax=Polytomella parva TaxID=51329 RepID=A0A7S0V0E3_9CHLO|mmetsp:Transcript_26998/g.49696  ORF Transcript_26998/g.49696 Transcript_26998/m.49696 type:complete len:1054 (+) Transcript_26998:41-3202(+)|eukprot:CAMPEP_0175060290 /NCGR_PEP_ID=MMETSP0052_2-20121109/12925_1 /TAXON_ID=51329 ORGANISM="Polytomella parva, Strain SAG 63-3" /NCGR_SAMPLE_ID=MMETSP0052_2 /ASSEMBLY_ACC=CAM_ASM_000194 /LENGTH=1053 /DNA_ID=CAMNT_0016325973 /DNA_START=36 /DNA_END=3200 /DNA_ORIENTATION=+